MPKPLRAAAALLAIEALALIAAAGFVLAETSSKRLATALFTAALFLLTGVVLALAVRGLLRLNPSARSPVVVVELLWLPIGYELAFDDNRAWFGGPIMLAALAVLYLVFTPPARAALDREPRD